MKNTRKKIGIVGHVIAGASVDAFGIGVAYAEYFSNFGDVHIISHTETEPRLDLDLVVVPGGPDVNPTRYLGEDVLSLHTGKPCPVRERFDDVLLPKYIEAGVPIFGICRGHQSIAVLFGGNLIQHMKHENSSKYDRTEKVHSVNYDSRLAMSWGVNTINPPKGGFKEGIRYITSQEVNSIHHQVVGTKPKDAEVLARYAVKTASKGDKKEYIEALYYPNHKIITVQWHPEECNDELSHYAIKHLLTLKDK